jgi:hypothetical protein
MGSPAAADAALTVGAVNAQDELAGFSSRGPRWIDQAIKPDITAPGVDIVAARAEGATIGEPVGDDYLRQSGTSMSAPHVAGAAAVLAAQHPGWTAERLKSALMNSADPAADLTVYQQGAGRVDLARATAQEVTATPASLSQGIARWPHSDDEPVTRTVTYHNHGKRDVTLQVRFAVRDPAGSPPPAGMFAVSDPQVTVPAGGAAGVTVTTDTAVGGPHGVYGGALTASSADGRTRVRTPIGVDREVESYDLTLVFRGHDGQPAVEAITRIVDLQREAAYLPYDPSSTVVVRLPKGRYYFESEISTPPQAGPRDPGGEPRWSYTATVEPQLKVDRDTTMVVDAGEGHPLGLLVDQPTAQPGWAEISFVRATRNRGTGSTVTVPDFERMFVRPSRTVAPPDQFEFVVAGILAEPDQAGGFIGSPYQYHVAWWADRRVPSKLVRRFRDRDLAKVRTLIAAPAPAKTGVKGIAGAPLPATLTEFYGRGRWAGELTQFAGPDQQEGEGYIAGLQRSYRPGEQAVQRWNQAVFGPAFPAVPDAAGFAGRVGNRMLLSLPLFTDQAADHYGYFRAAGDLVLYRNGHRVGSSEAPDAGQFDLLAGAAAYRLEVQATRSGVSELSTQVMAAWTFRSDTVQGSEPRPLPLLAVRFAPAVDQHNRAPSGRVYLVPIYLQRNGDPSPPATANLSVAVSYDDGRTCRRRG